MIAMPNSHLVLHKETLKQHCKNKMSIKHLIKIINLGAINCPVVLNGLRRTRSDLTRSLPNLKNELGPT